MTEKRLTRWEATPAAQRVVAILGDSIGARDASGSAESFPGLLRSRMAMRWGLAGLGLHGTWRSEWSFTRGDDAWTMATYADAWDVGPYCGMSFGGTPVSTMLATTATMVATWTRPSEAPAVTAFDVWLVDGPTSSDCSCRIDGGAWRNLVHDWTHDSSIVRIRVDAPVESTVEIRGASAEGHDRPCYLIGLEAFTGTGATLHDLTAGAQASWCAIRGPKGDWAAWLDVIRPQVVLVCFTNDLVTGGILGWNGPSFSNRLAMLTERAAPWGDVVPMVFWGQDRPGGEALARDMQSRCHAAAEAAGAPCIDLLDRYGFFPEVDALGYMADGLHPSHHGSVEVERAIWPLLVRGDRNALDRWRARARRRLVGGR